MSFRHFYNRWWISDRRRCWSDCQANLPSGRLQFSRAVFENALKRFEKITKQVKTVGHLNNVRFALRNTFDIFLPAVSTDNFNSRMLL